MEFGQNMREDLMVAAQAIDETKLSEDTKKAASFAFGLVGYCMKNHPRILDEYFAFCFVLANELEKERKDS